MFTDISGVSKFVNTKEYTPCWFLFVYFFVLFPYLFIDSEAKRVQQTLTNPVTFNPDVG
jgi:hypothetical protein